MYALIDYKGKQYKAEKGAALKVDKIDAEEGSKVFIDTVLLVSGDDGVKVGAPYVEGAVVTAVVGKSGRDRKVLVFKHKSKKDYHRLYGHRQPYTMITIEDIAGV